MQNHDMINALISLAMSKGVYVTYRQANKMLLNAIENGNHIFYFMEEITTKEISEMEDTLHTAEYGGDVYKFTIQDIVNEYERTNNK